MLATWRGRVRGGKGETAGSQALVSRLLLPCLATRLRPDTQVTAHVSQPHLDLLSQLLQGGQQLCCDTGIRTGRWGAQSDDEGLRTAAGQGAAKVCLRSVLVAMVDAPKSQLHRSAPRMVAATIHRYSSKGRLRRLWRFGWGFACPDQADQAPFIPPTHLRSLHHELRECCIHHSMGKHLDHVSTAQDRQSRGKWHTSRQVCATLPRPQGIKLLNSAHLPPKTTCRATAQSPVNQGLLITCSGVKCRGTASEGGGGESALSAIRADRWAMVS